jgi:hypothetical protein
MAHLIDKYALVAEIEKLLAFYSKEIEDNKEDPWAMNIAKRDLLQEILSFLNTLEVKEVDLELITDWFDHIAQIADDRMTLTNQRMTDAHALDEIKCLARNSSEFITKHYKTQKGE